MQVVNHNFRQVDILFCGKNTVGKNCILCTSLMGRIKIRKKNNNSN